MPEPLPADLAAALEATRRRRGDIGRTIFYFTETGSTNDIAARHAELGAPHGTTVVAAAQSAGRGRMGRIWSSPPGAGLYLTVIVRETLMARYLTLAGGVAVASGISTATGLPVEIKWPNDVVTRGTAGPSKRRKLAGVLAEASSAADGVLYVLLGIGINVRRASHPPEVADRATSIETELGRDVEPGPVLGETLAALAFELALLAKGDALSLLSRWRALAPSAHGSPVAYDAPDGRRSGVAAGLADDGALLVRTASGLERVISGEIMWK